MRIRNQRLLRLCGFQGLSPYASVEQPLELWIACLFRRTSPDLIVAIGAALVAIAYFVVND